MARQLKLTKKRQQWVRGRTVALKGSPLRHDIAAGNRYADRIERLTAAMVEEVAREVKNIFRSDEASQYFGQDASIASMTRITMNRLTDKFESLFKQKSRSFAEQMLFSINRDSKSKMFSSLQQLSGGLSIKTDFISQEMRDILKASTEQNVDLIRRIPRDYLGQVKTAVMASITQPDTGGIKQLQGTIHELLDERGRQIRNKARNTALDQTRKAYNNLNAGRARAVGITKYTWVHSGGGQRPREYHRDVLNGQVFSFDDPPVIDENTGERGIPGQLINCRCTFIPVVEFDDGSKQ